MNKYCRICWNTKKWQHPTGEARLRETGSYVALNGFGHEEWLFNFNWLLQGYDPSDKSRYRYGHLQPIGKFLSAFQRQTFDVLLYTYTLFPDTKPFIVARIDRLYVPDDHELKWARQQMVVKNWLSTMRQQLEGLHIDSSPLLRPSPSALANVRFLPRNVTFYDPWLEVAGEHKTRKIYRYHPLNWDDGFPPVTSVPSLVKPPDRPELDEDPRRSEAQRTRAAIEGTTYDLRHVQLQNRLYRKLRSQHGANAVRYEDGFVDLVVNDKGTITYIEVKMEQTAKRCIRLALGQLLEYSHYPDKAEAHRLLVVGEAPPTDSDTIYLTHIRGLYGLPIYYACWDWEKEDLEREV